MDSNEFWGCIDLSLWGNPSHDYKVSKRELRKLLPDVERLEEFRVQYDMHYHVLAAEVVAHERKTGESCGLGDDGFSDLIAHIVGSGQEEYNRVMESPQYALNRAANGSYVESFTYAIPYKEDYGTIPSTNRTESHIVAIRTEIEEAARKVIQEIADTYIASVPAHSRFHEAIIVGLRRGTEEVTRPLSYRAERMENEEEAVADSEDTW